MAKEESDVKPPSEFSSDQEVEFETTTLRRNVFFWAIYDLADTIF